MVNKNHQKHLLLKFPITTNATVIQYAIILLVLLFVLTCINDRFLIAVAALLLTR